LVYLIQNSLSHALVKLTLEYKLSCWISVCFSGRYARVWTGYANRWIDWISWIGARFSTLITEPAMYGRHTLPHKGALVHSGR